MNNKTGLISLGTLVAIALLPTQAGANALTSLKDAEKQPAALTSVESLPNEVPEIVSDAVPEETEPDAPLTRFTELTAVEPSNARVSASSNNNANALGNDLLLVPWSTNSSDLQSIEASLDGESGFQTPLDLVQAPLEPSQLVLSQQKDGE